MGSCRSRAALSGGGGTVLSENYAATGADIFGLRKYTCMNIGVLP
jgi:hypothetical protein